jgi:hypothetical protein
LKSSGQREPEVYRASDVDGVRHVIVVDDPPEGTQWVATVRTRSGVLRERLERTELWGRTHPNFLGLGERFSAWIAVADWNEELISVQSIPSQEVDPT